MGKLATVTVCAGAVAPRSTDWGARPLPARIGRGSRWATAFFPSAWGQLPDVPLGMARKARHDVVGRLRGVVPHLEDLAGYMGHASHVRPRQLPEHGFVATAAIGLEMRRVGSLEELGRSFLRFVQFGFELLSGDLPLPPAVQGLLLPGFGLQFKELARYSQADWVQAVRNEFTILQAQYSTVVLVANSLGAALALQIAAQQPLAGLILFAPFWRSANQMLDFVFPVNIFRN
jgi:hypothetical protein